MSARQTGPEKPAGQTTARRILGYAWAALAILLIPATFMMMHAAARAVVETTGVKITPWYTGGEVARMIPHESYETRIHRPVFDGLFGERRSGFVQVDFVTPEPAADSSSSAQQPRPAASRADSTAGAPSPPQPRIPEKIEEEIDLEGDGAPEFHVSIDGGTASVRSEAPRVRGLQEALQLDRGLAVRVRLENSR